MTCFTFYCWCPCHKRDKVTWVSKSCPNCYGNHMGASSQFDPPIANVDFKLSCDGT